MDTIIIKVEGMTCGHCEMTVKNALLAVKGVKEAKADHNTSSAEVKIKPGKASEEDLINAVNEVGYTASSA